MANVKKWLKCFDEIKESKVNPFKKHLVSESLNEHELNSYAVLQSAFVLFNGSLSENQERLYKFYLPALSKELKLAEIISQAQELNDEILKEYVKLLEGKDLLFTFLLDVLVFSRLDNSVNEDFKEVLNSFCHSLSIKSDDVNQVVYLSDYILGIEPDDKPELTDVFFNLIKNSIWKEFFAKRITKDNIQDIKGGIWCIDETIELLEGDILWKNSIIIFEGSGRLEHFNGSFTSEKTLVISPLITANNVTIDMDTVEIKGEYDSDEKITAFDINASKNVIVKNSKINTVNARAFLFCPHSVSGRFENTDFSGCGNQDLLGGAVNFNQQVYFNSCKFNECKSSFGGALFFILAYENSIVNCYINNCISIGQLGEGAVCFDLRHRAGNSGYPYKDYRTVISDSTIIGDISIRDASGDTESEKFKTHTIANTYISGFIYSASSGYALDGVLDKASIALSGVHESFDKMREVKGMKYCRDLMNLPQSVLY